MKHLLKFTLLLIVMLLPALGNAQNSNVWIKYYDTFILKEKNEEVKHFNVDVVITVNTDTGVIKIKIEEDLYTFPIKAINVYTMARVYVCADGASTSYILITDEGLVMMTYDNEEYMAFKEQNKKYSTFYANDEDYITTYNY